MIALPEDIHSRIKEARLYFGFTQEKLSQLTKVSVASIKNIEAQRCKSAGLIRIVVGVLDELLHKEGEPPILPHASALKGDPWLVMPRRAWRAESCGPGALLDADFHVVPFHGDERLKELESLARWCRFGSKCGVRLFHGAGGMGKTRLALELCKKLHEEEPNQWSTGFLDARRFPFNSEPWGLIPSRKASVAIVVDYAGEKGKTKVIGHLLGQFERCPAEKVRLIFLDRDDLWLGRLYDNKRARTTLLRAELNDPEFKVQLGPVASGPRERQLSFEKAWKAFIEKLNVTSRILRRPDLSKRIYQQVLFIHMQALIAVEGAAEQGTERAILLHVLHREREFWLKQMDARGISEHLFPAVEESVYWLSMKNGASTLDEADEILRKTPLLSDQPHIIIHQITLLLQGCYPSNSGGIAPLQPDLLRDFLGSEFLRIRARRR